MPSAAEERLSPLGASPPASPDRTTAKHYGAGSAEVLKTAEPEETIATTKEEEWIHRKQKEVTTTRHVATRVRRELKLEDGVVVEDSGPKLTTNTKEDTYTQEHHQTEHRALDQPSDDESLEGEQDALEGGEGAGVTAIVTSRVVANPDGKVRESHQRRVLERKQTDHVTETEEKYHRGDVTDEAYVAAVNATEAEGDIRPALRTLTEESRAVAVRGPQLVRDAVTAVRHTIDTEDTDELRAVRADGTIVTETKRTTEHEDLKDEELPENEAGSLGSNESATRTRRGTERRAREERERGVVVMAGGRRVAAHTLSRTRTEEAEKDGDPNMDDAYDWDSLSMRMRRQRRLRSTEAEPIKEVFVKRPIDFDLEEETRKKETSKWLENHFGSESRSSHDSLADDAGRDGYFNVSSKSRAEGDARPPPPKPGAYFKGVSEWSQRRPEPRSPSPVTRPRAMSPQPDYYQDRETPPRRERVSPVVVTRLEVGRPSPPERKRHRERKARERGSDESNRYDSGYRSSSRNETSGRSRDSCEDAGDGADEPAPDYSPPRERRTPPSHSPSPPPQPRETSASRGSRAPRKAHFATEGTPKKGVGAAIGNSIRRLVGKIRSASRERREARSARESRSSGRTSPTYRAYRAVDAHIAPERPAQRYYLGEDPFAAAGSIYGREHKYEGAQPRRRAQRDHDTPNRDHRNNNLSSTLGRFSHSTGRLTSNGAVEHDHDDSPQRSAQTLPRKLHTRREREPPAKPARAPQHASAAPHYQSHPPLNRSKSFAMGAPEEGRPRHTTATRTHSSSLYKSNPHLSRLDETHEQLKSPGIVSIINRSQRDLADAVSREAERRRDVSFGPRYAKATAYTNGHSKSYERNDDIDQKKMFMKGLRERAPELYHTLHGDDESDGNRASPRYGSPPPASSHLRDRNYSEERKLSKPLDSYSREASPFGASARLRSPGLRGGSDGSDNNFSETYRYRTRSGDPLHPNVTDTVETVSKKVLPSRDGRAKEIIESRELNSVTTSRDRDYRGSSPSRVTARLPISSERRFDSSLYDRKPAYTTTEKIRTYNRR